MALRPAASIIMRGAEPLTPLTRQRPHDREGERRVLDADAAQRLARLREQFPYIPAERRDLVAWLPASTEPSHLLGRLAASTSRARLDLVGAANREGGSGGQLGIFVELDDEFLKTGVRHRHESPAFALARERSLEELRQSLGIYHPDRVWFVSNGTDGAAWACSVTPILPVVRERLNAGGSEGPDRAAWELYLEAFRMSFEVAQSEGVLLDCNPNNFGVGASRLHYLDDDLALGGRMPFGHQVLVRLLEYKTGRLAERVHFLEEFALLMERYASNSHLRALVRDDLESRVSWPREPELREHLERLLARLERTR